jgi:hypothetical protein
MITILIASQLVGSIIKWGKFLNISLSHIWMVTFLVGSIIKWGKSLNISLSCIWVVTFYVSLKFMFQMTRVFVHMLQPKCLLVFVCESFQHVKNQEETIMLAKILCRLGSPLDLKISYMTPTNIDMTQ